MPFYNREREIKQLKAILSGEPNLVYFVYGPINSGKTALLTKVFEELSEDYIVFYFNFRGLNIQEVDDLIKVLFEVEYGKGKEAIKEIVKELFKKGVKIVEEAKGIPIPEKLFDYLFGKERKSEDVFRYLEQLFRELVRSGKRPVFVLDELQTIKGVINASGKPLIEGLFNFLVRLTKETHLCHSLCSTSDCLFIEDIYSNAKLQGRARYVLVDDLEKEEAFKVYEMFGFKNKELIWDYIGGKLSDMVILYEWKKQGTREEEALKEMLKSEVGRFEWMINLLEEGEKEGPSVEEIKSILVKFKQEGERKYKEVRGKALKFLIEENILFYNPVEGTVRPQSRLIHRVMRELF